MSANQVIVALNNMPLYEAIATLDLWTDIGRDTCGIIAGLPYTDSWAEAGIEGWWIQSDFNDDGRIEFHEGYDLVQLCGAIYENWDLVTNFLNSF